ncbi:cell division protein FtsQ [Nitrosomonas sp. Nm132]|jgi:cell division protein FtsQ|nr:cell division protein FtsQ [Nitrosomonas sp. Nm132]
MWNNYRMLNLFANMMFTGVILAAIYVLGIRVIKLPLFALKEISVEGMSANQSENAKLQHVTRQQIQSIVLNEVRGNFLTVNLDALREAFKDLPWVRAAKIQRNWPSGLKVMLEEYTAFAYWGDAALVNRQGEIFRAPTDEILPVFIGPTEESTAVIIEQYEIFNKVLEPIRQRAAEIELSPRHAWLVRLENGTLLKLGREKIETRLRRYVSVYRQSIVNLNQSIPLDYVDLRYPNGFAIRMSEAMPQVPRKTGAGKKL